MSGTLQDKQALQTTTKNEIAEIKKELKLQAGVLGGIGGTLWALELLDTFVLNQALNAWGVVPGKVSGLIGVLTMPFLHGGLFHLAANTFPLLFFSWLIMLRDNREWAAVTATSMVTSGVGTWLIGGANSVHVGASGLIFGYFGYLLTIGIFQRKFSSILLSLFIGLGYGGLVFGMFPVTVPAFVSWQAHLFGFIGGVISAWAINRRTQGGKRRLLEGGI
jgi:membrane associated rhomboid family serine protease